MLNAQLSPAWFEEREGKLTASNFAAAIGLNPYKTRQKLYREMVGIDPPFEGNERTDYGTLNEPNAIAGYTFETGLEVVATGFIVHPVHDWLGASPDGLVDVSGCIEAKCRFSGELYDSVPDIYMPQVQGVLECTGRDWCDFFSWIPGEIRVFRVYRSRDYWGWMFPMLKTFWQQVNQGTEPPRARKPTFTGSLIIEEKGNGL